jgi:Icc-related predicted phosphoesterase
MRLALISDTHGMLPRGRLLAGADAVIHAGDIAQDRRQQQWLEEEFFQWCERLGLPIHATLGNHDNPASFNLTKAPPNLCVHIDEAVEIGGVKFWFSPWSPVFGGWSWMLPEEKLIAKYARIPADTEVIVSHTPPHGVCDGTYVAPGPRLGSVALAVAAAGLRSLRLIVCGHIHDGRGEGWLGGVRVLNVSTVDELYRPHAAPVTWLDIDETE